MSLSPMAMVLNVIQTADLNLEEAAGELQDFLPDTHILATLGVCALGTSVYVWMCVCVYQTDVTAKECKYILKSLQEKCLQEGPVLAYLASYQHLRLGGGHLSAKQWINGSMFRYIKCPFSHLGSMATQVT